MPDSPSQVLETFDAAKDENLLDSTRQGQVVTLAAPGNSGGELWMTGDIHDHRTNFAKIVHAADLGNNPQRHLVLHELIHGDHFDEYGAEDSWQTLYKAAALKCDFPSQVHFLLANHDLAQIHGEGIMKAGLSVCEAFNAGVKRDFPADATAVTVAITEYLLSLPLAIRLPNRIFLCHSLPPDKQTEEFDFTVFERNPLRPEDYRRRTGPVYQLIWGRNITPAGVAAFAAKVDADLIITGHQPQEMGFAINGPQHLILASEHNQGVFLPLDLSKTYTSETLVPLLRKFVSVEM
jgi:hypothetical protein